MLFTLLGVISLIGWFSERIEYSNVPSYDDNFIIIKGIRFYPMERDILLSGFKNFILISAPLSLLYVMYDFYFLKI